MSLGSILVKLTMDTATFDTDAGRASKIAERRAKEIDKAFKQAGTAIGLALAAAATTLAATIKSSIDNMDDMSKAAQRVGVSTEEFSKLTYAAGLADVSMETLSSSLGRLTKAQAAALKETSQQAQVFDALGISIKNADGSLRESTDVLSDFADRFRDLKGSPEAMAAGFAIFGRSFQELIPLLKDGGDGIRAAGEELEAFGGVLSTEAGQRAEEFNDNLTRLRTAALSLSQAVAADLLHDLVKLTGQWVDMAKDGDRLESTASSIADSIRAIGDVIKFLMPIWTAFVDVVRGLTIAMAGTVQVATSLVNMDWAGMRQGMLGMAEGRELALMGRGDQPRRSGQNSGDWGVVSSSAARRRTGVNIRTTTDQADIDAYTRQLQLALAGGAGGGRGGKPKAAGESEAEKEVKRLNSAYESLMATQRERIALFGVEGEAAKVAYQIQEGSLKGLDEAKAKQLIADAAHLDLLDEAAEMEQVWADIAREQQRAAEERLRAFEDVNQAILDQIELLGMTRDEQEIWNNLAWAGVDAESERGLVIIENTKRLQELGKEMAAQIEFMDTVRDAGKGLFEDLANGVKPIDALGDAWDRVHQKLLSMAAEKLMDQIFGMSGDKAGGSTGGWLSGLFGGQSGGGGGWGSFFSSLFGGGRASGGWAMPNKMYEVNERGFEMATVGGRDYMLTGSQPVNITPNHKLGGGGVNQTMHFHYAAPYDARTEGQKNARVAFETREAMMRNG